MKKYFSPLTFSPGSATASNNSDRKNLPKYLHLLNDCFSSLRVVHRDALKKAIKKVGRHCAKIGRFIDFLLFCV